MRFVSDMVCGARRRGWRLVKEAGAVFAFVGFGDLGRAQFIVLAAACLAFAAGFSLYLIISSKRGRHYRDIIRHDTQTVRTITSTLRTGRTTRGYGSSANMKMPTQSGRATSWLIETEPDVFPDGQAPRRTDFGIGEAALEGRYVLEEELQGGGMSRIFVARNVKLGNHWIVKYIPNSVSGLAGEGDILKQLNHVGLPRIVDIFEDSSGIYLVESLVEGVALDVLQSEGLDPSPSLVVDWAMQLAHTLDYLHNMQPRPTFHFDLKPSNIIVTHDNRLVLIDFGVSRHPGETGQGAAGITYAYAAPEQVKRRAPAKYQAALDERFGVLPPESAGWVPDERTDIYSLGVILFELITKQAPTTQNAHLLLDVVPEELAHIIKVCLAIDPAKRYPSAAALLTALQLSKSSGSKMARTLWLRKLSAVAAPLMLVVAGVCFLLGMAPPSLVQVNAVTVSRQQTASVRIVGQWPSGETRELDPRRIVWESSSDAFAKIDGDRIYGLQAGVTKFDGIYDNRRFTMAVEVVEPMEGIVDISLRHLPGRVVSIFSGTSERDHADGPLETAEFVSPESVTVSKEGRLYISDAGRLRRIQDGQVDSLPFARSYILAEKISWFRDCLYVLTHAYKDEEGNNWFELLRVTSDGEEETLLRDDVSRRVLDFALSASDGRLYCIRREEGFAGEGGGEASGEETMSRTYLAALSPEEPSPPEELCALPDGTSALTVGEDGAVYLANPEAGVIYKAAPDEKATPDEKAASDESTPAVAVFAGREGEKAFLDGTDPRFYMPLRLLADRPYLYVWDFNVLRRLEMKEGAAPLCLTVAGQASVAFDLENFDTEASPAERVILPNSMLTHMAVWQEEVWITDPKRGVVWLVE